MFARTVSHLSVNAFSTKYPYWRNMKVNMKTEYNRHLSHTVCLVHCKHENDQRDKCEYCSCRQAESKIQEHSCHESSCK